MEQIKFESKVLHPEALAISREFVQDSLKSEKITLPYFTKYEQVALIAMRGQQLADGSKPLIPLDGIYTADPRFVWIVAEKEVQEGKLPYIIHRRLPNGNSEFWSASELKIIW